MTNLSFLILNQSGFEVVTAYAQNFFEKSGVELDPSLAALFSGSFRLLSSLIAPLVLMRVPKKVISILQLILFNGLIFLILDSVRHLRRHQFSRHGLGGRLHAPQGEPAAGAGDPLRPELGPPRRIDRRKLLPEPRHLHSDLHFA